MAKIGIAKKKKKHSRQLGLITSNLTPKLGSLPNLLSLHKKRLTYLRQLPMTTS